MLSSDITVSIVDYNFMIDEFVILRSNNQHANYK